MMRFDLARGEVTQALDRWRGLSEPDWDDEELASLALRSLVWAGRQQGGGGAFAPVRGR